MKKLLALMAVIGLAAATVEAGCGKKVTNEGTLSEYDADTKTLIVKSDDGKAKLTVTPKTEAKDKDGKKVELADLVGQKVKVVSEHKKIDSVTGA